MLVSELLHGTGGHSSELPCSSSRPSWGQGHGSGAGLLSQQAWSPKMQLEGSHGLAAWCLAKGESSSCPRPALPLDDFTQ